MPAVMRNTHTRSIRFFSSQVVGMHCREDWQSDGCDQPKEPCRERSLPSKQVQAEIDELPSKDYPGDVEENDVNCSPAESRHSSLFLCLLAGDAFPRYAPRAADITGGRDACLCRRRDRR